MAALRGWRGTSIATTTTAITWPVRSTDAITTTIDLRPIGAAGRKIPRPTRAPGQQSGRPHHFVSADLAARVLRIFHISSGGVISVVSATMITTAENT